MGITKKVWAAVNENYEEGARGPKGSKYHVYYQALHDGEARREPKIEAHGNDKKEIKLACKSWAENFHCEYFDEIDNPGVAVDTYVVKAEEKPAKPAKEKPAKKEHAKPEAKAKKAPAAKGSKKPATTVKKTHTKEEDGEPQTVS